MLKAIEEFTHERHAIRIDRKLRAVDVIDVLTGSLGDVLLDVEKREAGVAN